MISQKSVKYASSHMILGNLADKQIVTINKFKIKNPIYSNEYGSYKHANKTPTTIHACSYILDLTLEFYINLIMFFCQTIVHIFLISTTIQQL